MENRKRTFLYTLIVLLILLFFTLLIFYPRMKSSLQQSGMVEFVFSYLENRTNETSSTRVTTLYYPIPNLKDNSLTLNPYQVRIDSSLYRHNKIERGFKRAH
ncbi:MAG: hypothetical protein ACOXZZ_00950 [Sphaerochaetaceae bacterium]